MNSRHSVALLVCIIVGVIAGLFVGWFWGAAATKVAWLGKLFLNTLSMLVIPLLVSAVISGVTSIGDVRQLGKLSGVTIGYYLITVAIAVLIGLIMVNLIQPGVGVSTEGLQQPDDIVRMAEDKGIGDILLSLVAPNLIAAAAETNLLPLILWSVAFGIALASLGPAGRPAAKFFESLNEGMMLMVSWVMYFAPLGIFGLIAGMFGAAGSTEAFVARISAVGLHVLTVLSGLAIHFTILTLILLFIARQPIS